MAVDYQLGPDEDIGTAVLRAVSEFKHCEMTALPPLYETIDTDALERLAAEQFTATPYVAFYYADCLVAIHGDMISVSSESGTLRP